MVQDELRFEEKAKVIGDLAAKAHGDHVAMARRILDRHETGIEELCIIADLRMKMDSAEDVAYPAATTHVRFKVKFYLVPAVVITVQDALATDQIQVINKTREGFDVNITNGGAQVTRTFDWQARGF